MNLIHKILIVKKKEKKLQKEEKRIEKISNIILT
jgi:hypothetical protein